MYPFEESSFAPRNAWYVAFVAEIGDRQLSAGYRADRWFSTGNWMGQPLPSMATAPIASIRVINQRG